MNLKTVLLFLMLFIFSCQKKSEGNYVCTPCDLPCDEIDFAEAGRCPECNMILEKKLTLNKIAIEKGSGAFLIEGGVGKKEKIIKVYYHKPNNFTTNSKVLLVIPGAGRNGDSYRDAWIEESEKYGVLILSPMYFERDYSFGEYHLGGLVKDLNLEGNIEFVKNTNIAKMNEENIVFNFNENSETYIFNDFDRFFDLVKAELSLTTTSYDLFGHSAGGHILHRMALFHQNSKANRIYASNSSFYTLPNFENTYPFGLKNTALREETLKSAFAKKLVVFLGEQDNATETGGTFLRSKSADTQGLHRLARGNYFFERAKEKATELDADFNWQLIVVPNIGHDQKNMGNAAGHYLYNYN